VIDPVQCDDVALRFLPDYLMVVLRSIPLVIHHRDGRKILMGKRLFNGQKDQLLGLFLFHYFFKKIVKTQRAASKQ
jgi:hypothetical protein